MPTKITIGSTTSTDRLDKVYVLLNSIKKNKQPDTEIAYTLFVKFTPDKDANYCYEYFKSLISDDFSISIQDVDIFKELVNMPYRDHMYYAKCLFADYFEDLDRVLFLDVDLAFVRPGIEALWIQDITDYYLGAVIDPTWQYCPYYKHDLINTKTKNYFNAGVILFNLKALREYGKDKQLREWCDRWHFRELQYICFDQTLLNYLLKDKVKLINFKYNNTLLASLGCAKNAYTYYLNSVGYLDPLDSLDQAVVMHFCGSKKPWDAEALRCSEAEYPYKEEAIKYWADIYNCYKKPEIDGII